MWDINEAARQQVQFPEHTFEQLNKRILPFINYLISSYKGTNTKILLVSHKSVVSSIKHFLLTKEKATKDYDFRMGHIESIVL
jgi:broad specificity phosphatase PhoE